mgnify:FL=1
MDSLACHLGIAEYLGIYMVVGLEHHCHTPCIAILGRVFMTLSPSLSVLEDNSIARLIGLGMFPFCTSEHQPNNIKGSSATGGEATEGSSL